MAGKGVKMDETMSGSKPDAKGRKGQTAADARNAKTRAAYRAAAASESGGPTAKGRGPNDDPIQRRINQGREINDRIVDTVKGAAGGLAAAAAPLADAAKRAGSAVAETVDEATDEAGRRIRRFQRGGGPAADLVAEGRYRMEKAADRAGEAASAAGRRLSGAMGSLRSRLGMGGE